MDDLKEYLDSKRNNPFWWAVLASFVLINWKLVVYSIYEFKTVDFAFFVANLKDGYWLLAPFAAGLVNAILGQSFTDFLSALSLKVQNLTKLWYIRLTKDTTVAKSAYDDLKAKAKSDYDELKAKAKSDYDELKVKSKSDYDELKVKSKSDYDDYKVEARSAYADIKSTLDNERQLNNSTKKDLVSKTSLLDITNKKVDDLENAAFETHNALQGSLMSIIDKFTTVTSSGIDTINIHSQLSFIGDELQILLNELPIQVEKA